MAPQRRFHIVILAVLLVLASQACKPGQSPANTALPDLGTIQVGYLPLTGFAPFYLAVEKGYFEEQGLKVELQSFNSGSTMIAPLSTGQLDAGCGETGTALFNAIAQGLEVRVVASAISQPPGYGITPLLIRKDLYDSGEITTPADLKGRKISINIERGMSEYLVAEVLARGNLTVDDVELVNIPFPDMPAALRNKAVDAAYLSFPLAGVAVKNGDAVVMLNGDEITDNPQNGVLYFGKRFLQPENFELAVRFMVAYLRAGREYFYGGYRDEAIAAIVEKFTNVPVEVIVKGPVGFFDPNGEINWASTEKIQAYYLSRGYLELPKPLARSEVIVDTFLKEALERLARETE